MALPLEIQTLRTLIQRKQVIDNRRAALLVDAQTLEADYQTLFASRALGVTKTKRDRFVNLTGAPSGKVRVVHVFWVANVNGVDVADVEIVDMDVDT